MGNQEAETKRPALRLSPRRLAIAAFVALVAIGAVRCAGVLHYNWAMSRAAAEAKSNTHSIQLAVERCATDDPMGNYVTDVNEVISRGYLDSFPPNPFAGLVRSVPSLAQPRPMRPLKPGEWSLGDFVYIPIFWNGVEEESVSGYKLILCLPLSDNLNPKTTAVPKQKLNEDRQAYEIELLYRDPSVWR